MRVSQEQLFGKGPDGAGRVLRCELVEQEVEGVLFARSCCHLEQIQLAAGEAHRLQFASDPAFDLERAGLAAEHVDVLESEGVEKISQFLDVFSGQVLVEQI